jgi:hypothetical protein
MRILAIAVLAALASLADDEVRIGLITWQTDYDAALRLAREQDKPLLVHFGEHPG